MSGKLPFAFEKINYYIMIAGIILLFAGFYIMTIDKETYGFGFYGITLGPIVVMLGFVVEFFAILYRPKNKKA